MSIMCFILKTGQLVFMVFFVTMCSFAQGVRFQFYRTKACTTIEELDTAYSLNEFTGEVFKEYLPKNGTVYLPKTGVYSIFSYGPLLDTLFNIRDTGLFVFRFKEPDHGLYNTGALDTSPLYSQCDSLLNGYQEYHYPGGALEMRGTFKNGYPKDSIITFYKNGRVKQSIMRYPKIIVTQGFDSLGHKLLIYCRQNKSFMTYSEYKHKEFYPGGQIKRKESSIKRIIRLKEYYPNGQLKAKLTKNSKIEYYANGSRKAKYAWTYKTDHISKSKDFTIYRTEYDNVGNVTLKAVYEDGNYKTDQPKLQIRQSEWIVTIERYRDLKKVFSISNMDTKEFFEKHPNEVYDDESITDTNLL